MCLYPVTKISGKADWSVIPVLSIDRVLWSEDAGIRAKGQLCCSGDFLYVHQSAVEKEIRAEHTASPAPVYEDSCLEFFFMHKGDQKYFNFEINPNGSLTAEYGPSGADRISVLPPDPADFFAIHPGRTPDGWEVFYRIPLSFIRSFVPDFSFTGELAANMYKCGTKTVHRHFLSWAPIDLERPNFHCPAFFGRMVFDA